VAFQFQEYDNNGQREKEKEKEKRKALVTAGDLVSTMAVEEEEEARTCAAKMRFSKIREAEDLKK
jgi:hypothetical protein